MQSIHQTLNDGSHLVYSWFEAMHTRIDIVLWDKVADVAVIQDVMEKICAEVMRVERCFSCFLPESETAVLNRSAAGVPHVVSEELWNILSVCRGYWKSTGGLFDITADVALAGKTFDEKLFLGQGYEVIRLDAAVKVNLSGFLKGYALDRAVDMVREAAVENGLMNFGNSSIAAFGNHPSGDGWPVAVAGTEGKEYILHDECLTTSGNDTDMRKHIIHPQSGIIVQGKGMVSVVTESAAEGEARSTAAFIRQAVSSVQ